MPRGKQHHGPGSYRACRVCGRPVPIKFEFCDQCPWERIYHRLIMEFDAVDITEEVTRINGVRQDQPKGPQ